MSMQPYEKGMIFLRIRRGNYLTFRANRKKPHVNRRTHQSVKYQINFSGVSWGQLFPGKTFCMGSGVWQDYQSFPTCTLHQGSVPLHVGIPSIFPFFSRKDGCSSPHAQVLAIFPHAENQESGLTLMILLCVYFSLCFGSRYVNSPPRGLFFFPQVAEKSLLVSP